MDPFQLPFARRHISAGSLGLEVAVGWGAEVDCGVVG